MGGCFNKDVIAIINRGQGHYWNSEYSVTKGKTGKVAFRVVKYARGEGGRVSDL